ncbi:hypothetical protein CP532_4007 [Ophiocordyceps camponoti-leonardi (nom. inval.)]|nr:hypothetical protein CP532_4007 [Ophiocordyceps camponoti-leonardi (nom. inval.)]
MEALSIYESARRVPRKRVLVEPVFWTRLHLDLLSCRFSHCNPPPPIMMDLPSTATECEEARRRNRFNRAFESFDIYKYPAREGVMNACLCRAPSPLSRRGCLWLHVGSRHKIELAGKCYFLNDHYPVVAHLDWHAIWHRRNDKLSSMLRRYNAPIVNLRKLRFKMITPTEKQYDPYLVAAIIAFGQLQWRVLSGQTGRTAGPADQSLADAVTSRIIFTNPDDEDFLYIYSANISASRVNTFILPATRPSAADFLDIQITPVPYEPFETLQQRLLALILSATRLEDVDQSEKSMMHPISMKAPPSPSESMHALAASRSQ